MTILLEGQSVAKKRLALLKAEVEKERARSGRTPGLTVVRIGEDPASKVYVEKKIRTCEQNGIRSQEVFLPATVPQVEVLKTLLRLNEDPSVHGILVQLPLPKHLVVEEILESVDPRKDVDGFHPLSLGCLLAQRPTFIACTPMGIMNLLSDYNISVTGLHAVVMGRSRIVGRPLSLLLDYAGATVTVVHSQTKNVEEHTRRADLLVAAIGKPQFVRADHVKEGAIIVDVGIHRLADGRLTGDVDFESVKDKVKAITPVPRGVGPMTICTLLENTWRSFLAAGIA